MNSERGANCPKSIYLSWHLNQEWFWWSHQWSQCDEIKVFENLPGTNQGLINSMLLLHLLSIVYKRGAGGMRQGLVGDVWGEIIEPDEVGRGLEKVAGGNKRMSTMKFKYSNTGNWSWSGGFWGISRLEWWQDMASYTWVCCVRSRWINCKLFHRLHSLGAIIKLVFQP